MYCRNFVDRPVIDCEREYNLGSYLFRFLRFVILTSVALNLHIRQVGGYLLPKITYGGDNSTKFPGSDINKSPRLR